MVARLLGNLLNEINFHNKCIDYYEPHRVLQTQYTKDERAQV